MKMLIEYRNIEFFIKCFLISVFTILLNSKMLNINKKDNIKLIKKVCSLIIIGIMVVAIKYISNMTLSMISLDIFLSCMFSIIINKNIGHSILVTTISLSINYFVYIISTIINFIISKVLHITNEYLIFISILVIYIVLINFVCNIRKLKNGIIFLKSNENNEYLGLLTLNISAVVFLAIIMLSNIDIIAKRSLFIYIIIFSILMFITIQKSLQLYYKQKILIQDLNETKAELESKKKEIEELEKENLEYSKTSHSIAHKQKLLEYKLKELLLKNEFAEDMDIKDEINNLTKQIRTKTLEIELAKTNINKIDDILKYMQSECIKEKIDFQLQLNGNILYMINNYISEEELQILLADHIKNAIIAIKHTDNINKSILVRLGLIEGIYSVYIYDSGIEFNTETLVKLGKEPASTHLDEGGTGMGFMNTFDTLKKHKASMFIDEFNKPSKDNFTKVIKIIFDGKGEYKVVTYRYEEIKKVDINNEIKIIDKMDT